MGRLVVVVVVVLVDVVVVVGRLVVLLLVLVEDGRLVCGREVLVVLVDVLLTGGLVGGREVLLVVLPSGVQVTKNLPGVSLTSLAITGLYLQSRMQIGSSVRCGSNSLVNGNRRAGSTVPPSTGNTR